ncbi:MAG: YihY/virulence factor BrkB family protein [Nitrospirae bacterium]|nr:YihY/virulence factor BrkB family protein [Nitrospirota bacterium]
MADFFSREVWEIDTGSLGKFKSITVKFLRLLSVAFNEIAEGQLTLRAMSLVYTTLLSIVPLLAISFSVLKAFGIHNQVIAPYLEEFLAPLGSKGEEITSKIIGFIDNMRAGVLGSLGLSILVYNVVTVVQKIEKDFNYIWKIKKTRSWKQRFSNYISVLLIGPVLMFSAAGITASFASNTIVKSIVAIEPFGTFFYYAAKFMPYIIICGVFTYLYFFIPNTRVKFRSALFGGVFSGVLWQTAGWGFTTFVVSSAHYTVIYSGFAILIMFLIWLYFSWLVLLAGAQVSFYHQYPQLLSAQKGVLSLSNRLRERLAFLIMYFAGYHYYHNKQPWDIDSLVKKIDLPIDSIQDVIILLRKNALLLETADNPPAYVPAKDIETITLKEIFNTVRFAGHETASVELRLAPSREVDSVIKSLDEACESALGNKTLKDVVLSAK